MLSRLNMRVIRLFLVICVLTSAFFYVSDVAAASLQGKSYQDVIHASSDSSLTGYNFHTINAILNTVKLSDLTDVTILNDKYYSVDLETTVAISATQAVNWRIPYAAAGDHIVLLGSNVNTSQDFYFRDLKTFTMSGQELKEALNVSFRCYVFNANGLNVTFDGYVQIFLTDIVEVSSGTDEAYNAGYDSGYRDGEDFGYNSGYGSGYHDGQNDGYDEGFDAGVGSVDTDSYYDAGYQAGYDAAYVEGFDEGYLAGYSESLSTVTSDSESLKAGDVITSNKSHSFDSGSLLYDDANTPWGSDIFSDEVTSGGTVYKAGYAYNLGSVYGLFTSSSDVYAYRIQLQPTKVSLTKNNVPWVAPIIGSYSDVMSLKGEIGHFFVNGSNHYSDIWLVTDYKVTSIVLAPLCRYTLMDDTTSASYKLNWDFVLKIIPYTKEQYNSTTASVEKQTQELKTQMNDLKNGFDSSAGQSMNESFAASVNDYQTTEESLFSSAQSGLDSFNFVDFSSYPALVTSMSFVTSMMNAVYGAMGGETGPIGIVLSVLFSVMLVSMVIGLYRFYQDKKGGGD